LPTATAAAFRLQQEGVAPTAESPSEKYLSDSAVAIDPRAAIAGCGAYLSALLGFKPHELLGKHASLLFRNAYFYEELLNELARQGAPLAGDVLLRHKHGGLIPAAFQAVFSTDNGSRYLVLNLRESDLVLGMEPRNQFLFPEPNPLPVLSISREGILLAANPASWLIRQSWKAEIGEPVPAEWCQAARRVLLASGWPCCSSTWTASS
jgi:hypothetical protein